MQLSEIKNEIRSFLINSFLYGRGDGLLDDSPLMDRLVDSQGVIELVVFLQDRFSITVRDEDITADNLDSVNKASTYVERKLTDGKLCDR